MLNIGEKCTFLKKMYNIIYENSPNYAFLFLSKALLYG